MKVMLLLDINFKTCKTDVIKNVMGFFFPSKLREKCKFL